MPCLDFVCRSYKVLKVKGNSMVMWWTLLKIKYVLIVPDFCGVFFCLGGVLVLVCSIFGVNEREVMIIGHC